MIKSILKSFGYDKKVGAGSFIPENMFWTLAMCADSPAEKSSRINQQGDRRDERRIYSRFSSLANRIAGIPDGDRNTADSKIVENYIANLLLEGMAHNRHYLQIELDVQISVANFARIAL